MLDDRQRPIAHHRPAPVWWQPPSFGYLFGVAIGRATAGGALIGTGYIAALLLSEASSAAEWPSILVGAAVFGVSFGGAVGMVAGMVLAGPTAALLRSIPPWPVRVAALGGLATIGALCTTPIAMLGLIAGGGTLDPVFTTIVAACGAYGAFSGHRMVVVGARRHRSDPDA